MKLLKCHFIGNWEYDSEKNSTGFSTEDLDELPFFSLNSIAKATNGFSINNKIGEGGFGPVYKVNLFPYFFDFLFYTC